MSFVGRDLNDTAVGCSRAVCTRKEIIKNYSALQSRRFTTV